MTAIGENSASLGLAQLLLATVVLASYSFALGELVALHGRVLAAGVGVAAAAGLVGTVESWEVSFVILGSVPLIMGLLAFAAWILWKVTRQTTRPRVSGAPNPMPVGTARFADLVLVRWRSHMRSIRVRFQRQDR